MTADELENNLGTIAKSGSFDFKRDGHNTDDVDIIGQFGVGFYSAFMVADKIEVVSRPYGSDVANKWVSEGAEGYTLEECTKESFGTEITLYIKEDNEDEKYSEFLEVFGIVFKPEWAGLAMALSSVTVISLSLLLKRYVPPIKR